MSLLHGAEVGRGRRPPPTPRLGRRRTPTTTSTTTTSTTTTSTTTTSTTKSSTTKSSRPKASPSTTSACKTMSRSAGVVESASLTTPTSDTSLTSLTITNTLTNASGLSRSEHLEGSNRLQVLLDSSSFNHMAAVTRVLKRSQVRSMERRLTSGEMSEKSSVSLDEDSSGTRIETEEKDVIIKQLESEVQQQRQLRLEDARQVEAKAARIKTWVTSKLKELEEQNAHLKLQNAHCNDQMELLRKRLEHMQTKAISKEGSSEGADTTQRKHSLTEDSSLGSLEGEATTISGQDEWEGQQQPRRTISSSSTTITVAKKSPLMLADPSIWSSSNPSGRRVKDSRIDSGSVDLETPDEFTLNASSVFESVNRQRPNSDPRLRETEVDSHVESQLDMSLLPDRRQSVHTMGKTRIVLPEDESHDYAEIYSPPTELRDSGLTCSEEPSAPAPPLHKCPSWEAHIYAIAQACIQEKHELFNKERSRQEEESKEEEEEEENTRSTNFQPATLPKLQTHPRVQAPPTDTSHTTPRRRRLPTHDVANNDSHHIAEERSGYLLKLSASTASVRRVWRRRFFVLRKNSLLCFKNSKIEGKPSGILVLDVCSRVTRMTPTHFDLITTANQKWSLATETARMADEWVRHLNAAMRRREATTSPRLQHTHNADHETKEREEKNLSKKTIQGWMTRIKHGHAKRVWLLLDGSLLLHFRAPNDETPLGEVDLRDGFVERSERVSSDGSDEETWDCMSSNNSIAVFVDHVTPEPVYLVAPDEHECERWLYNLTIVSGCRERGTSFEAIMQQIMEAENQTSGSVNSYALWRHPLLSPLKDCSSLSSSLTTLASDELRSEAGRLYRSLLLFSSVVIESDGIDYHVMLAADAFQKCLDIPELQDELLCILIKQTGQHQGKGSKQGFLANASHIFHCDSNLSTSTANNTNLVSVNTASSSSLQSWMLMSLSVAMFPPSNRLLWFLRAHLKRHKLQNGCSETAKYANYSARSLERSLKKGRRLCRPSRLELLSLMLKNPDEHSMPHAMPVHLMNKSYRVVGFDGSTTVQELLQTLCLDLGLRPVEESGFALFSDDPLESNLSHALHPDDKICDIISRWETALRERGQGKFDAGRAVRLVLKQRLAWRRAWRSENDKERMLLVYQSAEAINKEAFPLTNDLSHVLIALLAQMHVGDVDSEREELMLEEVLKSFFSSLRKSVWPKEILGHWKSLKGRSGSECARIFMGCVRKWPLANAATFDVRVSTSTSTLSLSPLSSETMAAVVVAPEPMWLAVAECGLAILEPCSLKVLNVFDYEDVVTFGGCQPDDFMLVVKDNEGNTKKLLFHTKKPEILQITLLMADYMSTRTQSAPRAQPSRTTTATTTTTTTWTTTSKSSCPPGCETPKFARKCRP